MKHGNKGFTLLELMIVTVIVGILAGLALNKYITVVDRQRQYEAIHVLTQAYTGYQRLVAEGEGVSGPGTVTWARMGMTDPNTMGGAYFSYNLRRNVASGKWSASATRLGSAPNSKEITIDFDTGEITKTAFYTYAS